MPIFPFCTLHLILVALKSLLKRCMYIMKDTNISAYNHLQRVKNLILAYYYRYITFWSSFLNRIYLWAFICILINELIAPMAFILAP